MVTIFPLQIMILNRCFLIGTVALGYVSRIKAMNPTCTLNIVNLSGLVHVLVSHQ